MTKIGRPPKPKEPTSTYYPRLPAISRTLFRDTLTRCILEEDGKRLRSLCERLIRIALDERTPVKDFLTATALIMDRVDGKAVQSMEISAENTGPDATMFKITRIDNESSTA